MRAKDKLRLGALRGMRSAFIEAMKADGSDTLADDKSIAILRRLEKQRRESIEAFLPSLADEATTTQWVEAAIAKSGAAGPGDMGRVMGAIMGAHKGEVDGRMAKDIALRLLKP